MSITIDGSNQPIQKLQPKSSEIKDETKPQQEDKKMSTASKMMIGASALAAVVIAGIGIKKGINARQAGKEAEKLAEKLKKLFGECSKKDLLNPEVNEIVGQRLAEIKQLPEAEQLVALEDLNSKKGTISHLLSCKKDPNQPLLKDMEKLPQEVETALAEKDYLKAADIYLQELDKLPNGRKLKNVGSTVSETIKNTFGENAPIQPHTYDVSKEGDFIHISKSGMNGYDNDYAMKDGTILFRSGVSKPSAVNSLTQLTGKTHYAGKNFSVYEGTHTVNGSKQKLITLEIGATNEESKAYQINFLSPNEKLTPVQEDLIELAKHPEKFDKDVFDVITEFEFNFGPDKKAFNKSRLTAFYKNLNYDLLLSAIQSMAK